MTKINDIGFAKLNLITAYDAVVTCFKDVEKLFRNDDHLHELKSVEYYKGQGLPYELLIERLYHELSRHPVFKVYTKRKHVNNISLIKGWAELLSNANIKSTYSLEQVFKSVFQNVKTTVYDGQRSAIQIFSHSFTNKETNVKVSDLTEIPDKAIRITKSETVDSMYLIEETESYCRYAFKEYEDSRIFDLKILKASPYLENRHYTGYSISDAVAYILFLR
ncbi:gp190 [Sphingomonas phage PAU]|uniref:gp190 n=1 Tax=Sphingomonas phage PAU TaxID=1150991 RepID=UPI000257335C|nr:gp190 [Sphingomonas phage PAU]AFF28188.1 gp190 [Sphingomonas phage PAU]